MIKLFLFLIVLAPLGARAESLEVDLSQKTSKSRVINIFEINQNQIQSLPSISKLKYFEMQKKWKDCQKIAPKAFAENKILQAWVLQVWLNCGLKLSDSSSSDESYLIKPMRVLQKNIFLLDRGPWRSNLVAAWLKSLHFLIMQKTKSAEEALSWAFMRPELLPTDIKNIYFDKMQKNLPTASGEKSTYAELLVKDADTEAYQNIESLIVSKTREPVAELIIKYLKDYPSGKYAKSLRDRLIDKYNSLWDQNDPLAKDYFKQMLKLEPQRMAEIAQNLHRRADYVDALALAEEALQKGPVTSSLLWIAARSSLFLGQYEKSKNFFQTLVEKYSGSDEYQESVFRLGLLHYRLGNPQQSISYFEKLLSSGKDKGELTTRYWYVRALQALKSDRADLIRDQIITDYPFSYYGIKLLAEKKSNEVVFATPKKVGSVQKIILTGEMTQAWRRAEALLSAGWVIEANIEFNEFALSQNPFLQTFWAQKLASFKIWPLAIRMINQAFESSPDLKSWDLMKVFFPQDYFSLIKAESEKRKIHPRLVLSLIRQESAFGLKAISTSNAMGLMQMIPPTAQDIARQLKMNVQIPDDMYQPQINIPMGVFYISQMVDEFKGNIPLALASYNAGPTRMKLWLAGRTETQNLLNISSTETRDELWIDELPWGETSFYVKSILRNILLYQYSEEKALTLKPAFWSDLVIKK